MQTTLMTATHQPPKAGGQPAILAEGLTKRFGAVQALDGVDLELATGKVVALLGPNGAGKTTAVRILATLLAPDAGRARVAGFDVVKEAGAVRRLIGLSGQYAAVDAYLTGRENLRMIGRLYGLARHAARRRAEELLERLDLLGAAGRLVGTYSGGMRRRLDVAASLVAAPPVLFLDEPTTGLDPRGRIALWELLGKLTAEGTSLLLTTQYMEEADRLADAIVVIDRGRVVARGTADQLKARVGGDRLELHTLPGGDPSDLAGALAGLGSGPPTVDLAAGRVVLPVDDGSALLAELATRLAASDLRVADLALRRPTLDDVFLALTDHPGSGTTDYAQRNPSAEDGRRALASGSTP
jgi:ABC-2 type transport system ATP-binding protein